MSGHTRRAAKLQAAAVVGRWAARFLGAAMVLLFLALLLGEGPPSLAALSGRERLMFAGWGVVVLGLMTAWPWPVIGGVIALAGFGLIGLGDLRLWVAWPMWMCAAAGVLHVLCGAALPGRGETRQFERGLARSHPVLVRGSLTTVGIFALLAANEVLLNPPLMSGTFRVPPDWVGLWRADLTMPKAPRTLEVMLAINADGSVSGAVGDASIVDGQIFCNRSWFGKRLNWRTDYLIRGHLSGPGMTSPGVKAGTFSAPVNWRGGALAGAIFLPQRIETQGATVHLLSHRLRLLKQR